MVVKPDMSLEDAIKQVYSVLVQQVATIRVQIIIYNGQATYREIRSFQLLNFMKEFPKFSIV